MVSAARRAFLLGSLAVLLGPRAVTAQPPKAARVGLLASTSAETFAVYMKTLRKALSDLGWVEGQTLTIEGRYAGGLYDQLPVFAAELINRVSEPADGGADPCACRADIPLAP